MKAARLEDGTLQIKDLPVPVPGDEEALIRISASGVCHSDLHIARGDWYGVTGQGVFGHEAIGVVEQLGSHACAARASRSSARSRSTSRCGRARW